MTDNEKEVSTLEDAAEQATSEFPDGWETFRESSDESSNTDTKAESTESDGEQSSAEKKEDVSPKEDVKEEPKASKDEKSQDDESHLPEELRTPEGASGEELKRIRGFQASYTRRMQGAAEYEKQLESKLRSEYEQKFQTIVSRLGQKNIDQSTSEQSKTSLRDFFPDADPNQLKPLEDAFSAMIKSQMDPLVKENTQLKEAFMARRQQEELNTQWSTVKQTYSVNDDKLADLVAWAHANPERARGKSIEDIYLISTWENQKEAGKREALKELKRKESESLESESAPNTVENIEVNSLMDAVRVAEKKLAQGKEHKRGK